MRVTRKALQARIKQLEQQLAAGGHHSRRSLNEHIVLVNQRNLDLLKTVQDQAKEIDWLKRVNDNTPPR